MESQGGRTCIGCGSTELETVGRGRWCLDCGTRFELSPAGAAVRSVRAWWALTVVNAVIGALSFAVAAAYLARGDPAFAPVFALFGLLVVAIDRERFRAAAARLR